MSDPFALNGNWYPPDTDFNPPRPRLWDMAESVRALHAHSEAYRLDDRPVMPNRRDVREAYRQLLLADPDAPLFSDLKLPPGFIRPEFHIPDVVWSDLISMGGYRLCSRRLREAMALPAAAAQFHPVDLDYPSEVVAAKEYQWLSWLNVEHDMVDAARSTCSWTTVTRPSTGSEFPIIDHALSISIRHSFQPRYDLFEPFGMRATLCATPALQRRVVDAGCVGIGFLAFGAAPNAPRWISDEDGERILDPNQIITALGTPAAALRERPDLT